MIKTKIFAEDFNKPKIDNQINRWLANHPDYIIVDIKLQTKLYQDDSGYNVFRDALVIYREYENV